MRRRDFITVFAGSAAAWPLAAVAQQTRKLPTVGFLGTATPTAWNAWITAFMQRLRELGWIEGRTVAIEVRWAEGRRERFAEIAAEFMRLRVDVIVTAGSAIPTIKTATSSTPIVFALASDPVGGGYVASLARPDGNITGLTIQAPDLAGKRLEILREIVPRLHTVAVLVNVNNPGNMLELAEVQAAARTLGLDVVRADVRRAEDIAPTTQTLKGRVDALYICADPLFALNVRLITLTLVAGLPTIHNDRESITAGGLVYYGANVPALFRRAADFVDKILRGTKPADLPVEQPTKFEFVVNLTTAKTLGLEVPPMLLTTADEVIEKLNSLLHCICRLGTLAAYSQCGGMSAAGES